MVGALLLTGTARAQEEGVEELRQRLQRAEVLERAGRTREAAAVLESVLDQNPAQPAAILGLERLFRRTGQLERMLVRVRRAIEAEPESVFLRQVELRVLADLGLYEELRAAGERWIAAHPRSHVTYREFAAAVRRLAGPQAAERLLLRGREALDRTAALAPQLADLYMEEGRWPDAAREWVAIARAQPGMAWELVTFKLETAGPDAASAGEALMGALDPQGGEVERKLYAVSAVYAGRTEQARALAADLLETLDPADRRDLADRLAAIAARHGHLQFVAWTYRQILPDVEGDSTRWELTRQIVRHDLSAGDTARALGLLDSLLDQLSSESPARRRASTERVRLYASMDPGESERAFARHVRRYPDDRRLASLALTVADASLRAGRYDEAERTLGLVDPAERESVETLARFSALRGYLALYRGEHERARSELESAARGLKGEARGEALRVLGFLRNGNTGELLAVAAAHRAGRRGEPLEAFEELMDRLDSAPPSTARSALLLWAGELALAAGAIDRAEPVLRSLRARFPESGEAPVALLTLAEALARQDRLSDAIALLEELIVEYPESALTPIGRRRLAEFQAEVPRS